MYQLIYCLLYGEWRHCIEEHLVDATEALLYSTEHNFVDKKYLLVNQHHVKNIYVAGERDV